MAIRLYQFAYSPYAAKVRKLLELKKLAYEVVEVPYLDRRSLPGGGMYIPVLTDGETVVQDSSRICAYLDERYPPSQRPPLALIYEQWNEGVLEDVAFRLAAPLIEDRVAAHNGGREDARGMWRLVKERKFGPGCVDAWRRDAPQLTARLHALLAPIAQVLSTQPCLLGAEPTLADAALWGNLHMIEWAWPGHAATLAAPIARWYARL